MPWKAHRTRALEAMRKYEGLRASSVHLAREAGGELAAGNHRNGYPHKSVTLADDRVVLDILRDRNGPTIRGAVHARKMISATG